MFKCYGNNKISKKCKLNDKTSRKCKLYYLGIGCFNIYEIMELWNCRKKKIAKGIESVKVIAGRNKRDRGPYTVQKFIPPCGP